MKLSNPSFFGMRISGYDVKIKNFTLQFHVFTNTQNWP